MKKQLKKGFTLTELVIVIVIIAILAAVLIPSMTGYVNRAKKSNATQEAATMYSVYAAWLIDDTDKYGYGAEEVTIAKSTAAVVTINKTDDPIVAKEGNLNQFAAYVCEAQDVNISSVDATSNAVTLSNKQVLTAVSASSFSMKSSGGYTVKVTVNDGVPSYEVSEKAA